MSYQIIPMKCECGHTWDTSFGVVGRQMIAEPTKECPRCGSSAIQSTMKYYPEYTVTVSDPPPVPDHTCVSALIKPGTEPLTETNGVKFYRPEDPHLRQARG